MKRILLATDGSGHALGASRYLADLYRGAADVEITALHISPPVPPLYREQHHDPQIRKVSATWQRKKEQEAKEYLQEATGVLQRGGFKRNQIKTKHAHQISGVARDILQEVKLGHHDAFVIGKKGMGWLDDVFLGSITSKLLEISENHPMWLIDGNKRDSRRVLVAMDHTDQALQVVRYVGHMLQGLSDVEICLYHYYGSYAEKVSPAERQRMKEFEERLAASDKHQMDHFFGEAQRILEDFGFHGKAVQQKFSSGESASVKKVSQRILREARGGNHGTLVIGRKGATDAREFRLGSVASRIAAEAEACAVWIV